MLLNSLSNQKITKICFRYMISTYTNKRPKIKLCQNVINFVLLYKSLP